MLTRKKCSVYKKGACGHAVSVSDSTQKVIIAKLYNTFALYNMGSPHCAWGWKNSSDLPAAMLRHKENKQKKRLLPC